MGTIFILWAIYCCFKLLDDYVIYYYCVWVLFCCGVVLLVRIFLLNTDYSAKGCEEPSLKLKGIINAQYHEDVSSRLDMKSVMLFFVSFLFYSC